MSVPSLSMTERRVGTLVAADRANVEIARQLLLSVQAVEWSVAKLCRAFGVESRDELKVSLARLHNTRSTKEERCK